ncbi:MAG: glycosyltransferase family 4 protein [Saprospiraceae bacterium]|nr:glycosyltransferase family 4 protein [Saprospiraceae bacterium]
MSKVKFSLFAGPYPNPLHGQSYAFKLAYDHYKNSKILLSQNLEGCSKFIKIVYTFKAIWGYFKVFSKYNIRVVYIAGSRSAMGALKDIVLISLAKYKRARIVLHIHAARFDLFLDSLPFFIKKLYIRSYQNVDVFIALLPKMISEYSQFLPKSKVQIVGNFYDPIMDSFTLTNVSSFSEKEFTISYYSNLLFSKGIFDLLESFKEISKKFPYVKLQIAGSIGSDHFIGASELKVKFDTYLVDAKIEYVGMLKGYQKIEFLQKSHCCVLPTFHFTEAFPISLIEAMRCGNAIIVTDINYLSDLVSSQSGFVVPIRNIQSISNAIEKLICDRTLLDQMRKYNIQYTKDQFNVLNYNTRLENIIDHLA